MTFCNQRGCGAIATKLAHWPGKEQALPMCSDHATWAREVISATGGVQSPSYAVPGASCRWLG